MKEAPISQSNVPMPQSNVPIPQFNAPMPICQCPDSQIAKCQGQSPVLVVHEIYRSIQGESTYAGRPCVFVRLTACNLRCRWCDTTYAFHEGRKMSVDEVIADVESH